jgi:hypothetical protein
MHLMPKAFNEARLEASRAATARNESWRQLRAGAMNIIQPDGGPSFLTEAAKLSALEKFVDAVERRLGLKQSHLTKSQITEILETNTRGRALVYEPLSEPDGVYTFKPPV